MPNEPGTVACIYHPICFCDWLDRHRYRVRPIHVSIIVTGDKLELCRPNGVDWRNASDETDVNYESLH